MQGHDPEGAPDTSPQRGADDFRPTAALETLQRRALLLRAVRAFFDERGYFEVETPLLSQDVCVDAWLDPFIVPLSPDSAGASRRETWYLQTSPEFGMKRLLAAGARAIYQITRSFRRGECGARHNPEFTILEWYRTGDTPDDQMQLVEDLVRRVAETASPPGTPPRCVPFRRLSYDDAFAQFAGTRVLHLAPCELKELARARSIPVPARLDGTDRDAWLNLLLAEVVEPKLGGQGAVFLYDYPHTQAALSTVRPGPPPVAERFELYLDGIEICNGYHELTDADELAARMCRQSELRRAAGLSELPVDSRLLRAMRRAGLPACTGVALGFDRLALWALGQERLADVMAFPFDRA